MPALTSPLAGSQPGPSATPATPPPRAVATPFREVLPPVATPGLATPPARVTPTPSPISPDGRQSEPTPEATASRDTLASPSPQPSASGTLGPYRTTQQPMDLALSGPAFFVLATKPEPTAKEDLLLSRHGHFRMQQEMGARGMVWRLRHGDLGLYVVGFSGPQGPDPQEPEERTQLGDVPLWTRWRDTPASMTALTLDAERNPQANSQLRSDHTGLLQLQLDPPRAEDRSPLRVRLALIEVERPEALLPASGTTLMFRYAPAAGPARLGVAVSGAGRVLGSRNLVLTGRLETP